MQFLVNRIYMSSKQLRNAPQLKWKRIKALFIMQIDSSQ